MVVFVFVAIFMLAGLIAYKHEKKLADTLGIVCCGCILVLYVFAYFKRLYWIDYVGILVSCLTLFKVIFDGELRSWFGSMMTIQNGCILVFLVLLSWTQLDRLSELTGEAAFWAADLKSIYMGNGFPGRFGNAVPEYGANPPAVLLFKWLFLHMSVDKFTEGLGYAGYVCLNFILLLPFISRVRDVFEKRDYLEGYRKNVGVKVAQNNKYHYDEKRLISKYKVRVSGKLEGYEEPLRAADVCAEILVNIAGCIVIAVFALASNTICTKYAGADVVISVIYGLLLWNIWNMDEDYKLFYYVRLGILGAMLVLCETTGIILALSALALMIVCFRIKRKNERFNVVSIYETDLLYAIYVTLSWIAFFASWVCACIFNKRIVDMSVGYRVSISDNLFSHISLYLKEIVIMPAHGNTAYRFGISVAGIFLLSIALLWWLEKKDVIDVSDKKIIISYMLTVFLIANILFFIYSFSRVGNLSEEEMRRLINGSLFPFVTGALIFVLGIWLDNVAPMVTISPAEDKSVREFEKDVTLKKVRIMYLSLVIIVLSVCDLPGVYNSIAGYRSNIVNIEEARKNSMDKEAELFVKTIKADSFFEGRRILYIRDSKKKDNDSNGSISYECIPVSVIYAEASEETEYCEVGTLIQESGAQFIYMDEIDRLKDDMSMLTGEEFLSETIYTVGNDGTISRYYENIDRDLAQ